MTYPPRYLHNEQTLVIAQLSDLHLTGVIGQTPSYQKFLQILTLAQSHQPDLLLLTGDLVNDGDKLAYDWLFEKLQSTGIDFACIAGNHDLTVEHDKDLPFYLRQFEAICADGRLLNNHKILLKTQDTTWQLLLLSSALGGQIHGQLSLESLAWLECQLMHPVPTLIAMHHHPIKIGTAWMDEYRLQNSAPFWQLINQAPQVQAILCGHVHQAQQKLAPTTHHCTVYTCPSTDRQFMPHQEVFTLDNLPSGLRILHLNNHLMTSFVQRLNQTL